MMNKKIIALAGLLAVCGFMTGCGKKCQTNRTACQDKKARKQYKKRAQRPEVREERNYMRK